MLYKSKISNMSNKNFSIIISNEPNLYKFNLLFFSLLCSLSALIVIFVFRLEMLKWTVSRSLSTTSSTPHGPSTLNKAPRKPFRDLSNTPPTSTTRSRQVSAQNASNASKTTPARRRRCRSHGTDLRTYFQVTAGSHKSDRLFTKRANSRLLTSTGSSSENESLDRLFRLQSRTRGRTNASLCRRTESKIQLQRASTRVHRGWTPISGRSCSVQLVASAPPLSLCRRTLRSS